MSNKHRPNKLKKIKYHVPKEVELAKAKAGRSERGKELQKLYHTKTWRKMRETHLKNNKSCVMCGQYGNHCDHIKAHEGNLALFYSPSNIQTLCHSCHSKKTAKEDHSKDKLNQKWVNKF